MPVGDVFLSGWCLPVSGDPTMHCFVSSLHASPCLLPQSGERPVHGNVDLELPRHYGVKLGCMLISLSRLECELPETQDRFQDNASTWSDANAAIPSIEERLTSLERGMGEMIHLMRQMVNQPSTAGGSPHSHVARSVEELPTSDQGPLPSFTLKPVQLIRDLQHECFNGRENYSSDVDLLGDVVSQGIIDAKLSLKLVELCVSLWCSIGDRELTILQVCGILQSLGLNRPLVQHSADRSSSVQYGLSVSLAILARHATRYHP